MPDTLLVLGTHLRGVIPFKNCVVNGTVLAEDGKKMSKRLKNYRMIVLCPFCSSKLANFGS